METKIQIQKGSRQEKNSLEKGLKNKRKQKRTILEHQVQDEVSKQIKLKKEVVSLIVKVRRGNAYFHFTSFVKHIPSVCPDGEELRVLLFPFVWNPSVSLH